MQSTLRKTLPELAAGDTAAAEQFIAELLTLHRGTFGDARMDAGDDDTGDDDEDDDSSDDDTDGKGKGGSDDTDEDDDDSSDDDKPLGEADQKALDRMKAERKADRKAIRDLRAENTRLKAAAGKKPAGKDAEDKPDAEEIRKQARAEADAEILQTRVLDKIEARTDGRFNIDPEDVAALVMRRAKTEDFLDSDGAIDTDEIDEALAQLLKDKPGLATGKGGKRFKGGSDSGRRKDTAPKAKNLTEALEARLNK